MKRIVFAAPRIKQYETDDFKPSGEPRFIAVALNGSQCQLQCDHCCTRMLKALYQVHAPEEFTRLAERVAAQGCKGILLTGGCAPDGTIPLRNYATAARDARGRLGLRFAVHTKLVTEQFAEAAANAGTDLLMTDLVGDDESLRRIYHLADATTDDVRRSLDLAEAQGLSLAPHIMIGIAFGRIVGERIALEMLQGRNVAALSLVVLSPLRNTPMQNVQIDAGGVLEMLSIAREMYPKVKLTLGCAKTGGRMQRMFEEHALRCGYDAIAYPSDGIVSLARQLGYDVRLSESCCAMAVADAMREERPEVHS